MFTDEAEHLDDAEGDRRIDEVDAVTFATP